MGAPEVAVAVAHLFPANRTGERVYLEWGSGGSSAAFAASADRSYSIEHDPAWCASVSAKLAAAGLSPRPVTMRPQYAPIYDWYDTVASTAVGSVPRLVVLRPKRGDRLPGGVPVAPATVRGIYARLRERGGGGWVAGASAEIAERVRTGGWVAGASEPTAASAAAAAAVGAATIPGA
ncbi:hypothetical protein I4F81_001272 [Pyropia yezoensis]|uniref:Uncharacterized protein n=1 Tax=Pyropia yezoensis TaxID=2788 RepID=A0ACC3BLQ4_PYRYE|nr:hypothetical protein I4F81_001272 [Neopyropia yezoensis]